MKATGVIRRIDELGRIVIPKEIRKVLRLRVGENLEIYVKDESIILKKFSMINKISDLAQELTDSIYTFIKSNIIITDMSRIIAASGPLKKRFLNKELSDEFILKIEKREKMLENHKKDIKLISDLDLNISYVSNPIIKDGETIGMILIFSEEQILTINELHILEIVSSFISKYLEE